MVDGALSLLNKRVLCSDNQARPEPEEDENHGAPGSHLAFMSRDETWTALALVSTHDQDHLSQETLGDESLEERKKDTDKPLSISTDNVEDQTTAKALVLSSRDSSIHIGS
jgi:hypothetical protein